ncbi:MAG TPA: hypothetical protein VGK39_05885 [Cyclobacteriaceae bacterium]
MKKIGSIIVFLGLISVIVSGFLSATEAESTQFFRSLACGLLLGGFTIQAYSYVQNKHKKEAKI